MKPSTIIEQQGVDEIALAAAWLRAQANLLPGGASYCLYLADALERGAHLNTHASELAADIAVVLPTDGSQEPDRVVLAAAVKEACDRFAVHPRDLLSDYRYAFLSQPRFAIYVALTALGWGKGRVARVVGRDRSSVRNGLARAEEMVKRDPVYRKKVAAVAAAVKEFSE